MLFQAPHAAMVMVKTEFMSFPSKFGPSDALRLRAVNTKGQERSVRLHQEKTPWKTPGSHKAATDPQRPGAQLEGLPVFAVEGLMNHIPQSSPSWLVQFSFTLWVSLPAAPATTLLPSRALPGSSLPWLSLGRVSGGQASLEMPL